MGLYSQWMWLYYFWNEQFQRIEQTDAWFQTRKISSAIEGLTNAAELTRPCPMEASLPPYGFVQRALGLHPPALGQRFLKLCSKHPWCFSSGRRTFWQHHRVGDDTRRTLRSPASSGDVSQTKKQQNTFIFFYFSPVDFSQNNSRSLNAEKKPHKTPKTDAKVLNHRVNPREVSGVCLSCRFHIPILILYLWSLHQVIKYSNNCTICGD